VNVNTAVVDTPQVDGESEIKDKNIHSNITHYNPLNNLRNNLRNIKIFI